MFCRFCGKPVSIDDRFCAHCGKQLGHDNDIKKFNLKAYSDEMSFSSEDMKKVQALLEKEEKLEQSEVIYPLLSKKEDKKGTVSHDEEDPDLTLFFVDNTIEYSDRNEENGFSFKRLFLRLVVIGVCIGVFIGMIVNFGLDIL